MQGFAVILFALVALFAIVVPSSASTLSHVKRETNADRFARGLPPLPPTRRATAKRQQNSQPSVPYAPNIVVTRSLTYSGFYLAPRAGSKFAISTATLMATSRTDRLARTYICACIMLDSLGVLIALFLSNGVNLGNDPDYSDLYVIFNPVEQSIFCLVSNLETIVSRQSS